ncbi:MAG TPA: thiamine pyrophosphate-dependent enzyme, partial [Flavobacterium sp.]|nr:thiamine pyrophosphate-dependent enzyme [Flavobacterium sp.]
NHSLYNANLTEEASKENDFKINEAIDIAFYKKGPVHINAPFEEPLYETVSELSVDVMVHNFASLNPISPLEDLTAFVDIWNQSTKKLVLVGVNDPNMISETTIENLANDESVVVMTETTSNLHHPGFISNIDTIITPFTDEDFVDFCPDVLVTFGGMIVSKRIKAFLRKYKPKHHWHIDSLRAYDTFGVLSKHFEVNPNSFFESFLPLTNTVKSDYFLKINHIKTIRKEKQALYLAKIPFSDFVVFDTVIKSLPHDSQLQISNSSAIRYAQLMDIDSSIEVFCNRGTSGIDGSTSTAIGAALASTNPTIFISGDVSFLYDSNALWNNYIPANFKIIIINNGGGGIFRILPGHQENSVFNTYFETAHNLTAEHLVKMYGFEYLTANDKIGLENVLTTFYTKNDKPSILEIFTPTLDNDGILLQFFKELV